MPLDAAAVLAALTPEERATLVAAASTTPQPPEVANVLTAAGTRVQEAPPAPAVASPWAELDDFYDDTLQLRFKGHEYVLHAVDVQTGLMCQRLVNLGLGALTDYNIGKRSLKAQEGTENTLDDSTEEDLYRRLLGGDTDHPGYVLEHDVWAQVHMNRLPWPLVRHMGVTALMWAGRDRTTALEYWLDGARPKAPEEPAPTTPKKPRDRLPSAKADGASTTRRPASTSSTTSRKRTRKATPGQTS